MSAPESFDSLRTDALLTHVYRGNQDAWREVYRRYRAFLLIAASQASGASFQDAEDLVQSGFLSAWNRIESFENRGRGSFRAWLRQIVVHKNIEKLRRVARTEKALQSDWMDTLPARSGSDPEKRLVDLDEQDRLVECIVQVLDPEEQELIALIHFEGLSMAHVAEVMDVTRGTVHRRHRVAIAKITARLTDQSETDTLRPADSTP